jgi:hypothetical protein
LAAQEAARKRRCNTHYQGKYALLFSANVPFYQETDDGCARYVPR